MPGVSIVKSAELDEISDYKHRYFTFAFLSTLVTLF